MKRILVIEDDVTLRANILEWLSFENFEVIGAPNGMLGLQIAREQQPDLIISDIMMPEHDGFGLLQDLKTDPTTRDIPIIFLTANKDTRIMQRSLQNGVIDYVTKPFQFDDLLEKLNRYLPD